MPALFPLRRLSAAAPKDQRALIFDPPRTRGRGMFGGPARGILRREDGDPGTALNYLLFGRQGVSGMREDRMNRDLFGMQTRTWKREEEEARRLRENEDAAIASLSPELQPWARLAPEAAARAQFEDPPETYGDLEAIDGRLGQRNMRTGQYDWAPQVPRGGSGRTQYRPVTPEEVRQYSLPGNGAGFVMGDNGRPIRVGGGGTFSADQRARVEIGIEPALEAVQTLDNIEEGLTPEQRAQGVPGRERRQTPRNREWGASLLDAIDGEGTGAAARAWGGEEFQSAVSASSAFEAAMLPILSGAAVTPTEAQRMIRSALPQLGDGPRVLAEKARRRHQMINGAAMIGGRSPPYPEDGVPQWATDYQSAMDNTAVEDAPPEGVTQEEWDVMTPEERSYFQ